MTSNPFRPRRRMRSEGRSAKFIPAFLLLPLLTACASESPIVADDPATPAVPSSTAELPDGFTARPTLLLVPSERDSDSTQVGTGALTPSVVSLMGGQVTTVKGPDGSPAFRMPRFTKAVRYPRAVIMVRNASGDDQLSPGLTRIVWGADFRIDAQSEAENGVDNGDNLIQRGLSSEPSLYKAELDGHRPGCTARGTNGTVIVRARREVKAEHWYRLRCIRDGNSLVVQVRGLDPDAGDEMDKRRKSGPIGSITMSPSVPLAIGGKLGLTGRIIAAATDQFNGAITNAMVDIDSSERPR